MEHEFWHYATGLYKVYTSSYDVKQRFIKDLGLEVCNHYELPTGWDFIIPKEKVSTAKKIIKVVERDLRYLKDEVVE